MKSVFASLVVFALAGCATIPPPRWARNDVKAQASHFCDAHKGIRQIQPRSDQVGGNYWLICGDGKMQLVSIETPNNR
jgi:starvation-inducible outer membrane lipoprotein